MWSCWCFSLWWCSSGEFWSGWSSPSGAPLLAVHSCSWQRTRFSVPQQTQNRHFWKQDHTGHGNHCRDRPQIFQVKVEIQLKATKRQRFGLTCPWLLWCTELKHMGLQELRLQQQLSKVTSVCRMEISELSPEKPCIRSQYIRKIPADTQTRCKVKESLGVTKGHTRWTFHLQLTKDRFHFFYLPLTWKTYSILLSWLYYNGKNKYLILTLNHPKYSLHSNLPLEKTPSLSWIPASSRPSTRRMEISREDAGGRSDRTCLCNMFGKAFSVGRWQICVHGGTSEGNFGHGLILLVSQNQIIWNDATKTRCDSRVPVRELGCSA